MKRDGKHNLTHTTGNYLRNSFDTTILQQITYEQYSNHFPYMFLLYLVRPYILVHYFLSCSIILIHYFVCDS